ncbi:platelet-derived growth factor subunit B-like [Xyrauchen texanus]|uniref:platelet-derived growth factor subunit B-like n=1 Tax=Xyrauchen texanus TaxID=154827 RepID=UPI00224261CD|nr:platelet-derived growth factor subunit B-like [Xyrauchen texanus]
MSSLIPLLLAVLAAACLRIGSAEVDPLPAAVVELVKGGSLSSMQDLQFLLLSESIEIEPDSHYDNDTSSRLPRSLLDAQPAQQAICKVRTEVIEVTRSMLDRSNANFMLWPPCVEVQRCSGCCNTKSLQCVPVLTHTRYLQVMKIQYVNKQPLYDKAIVSVLDHVECRCQPAPRSTQRRKSSATIQVARDRLGKTHFKDELHRRDELKHNQRLSLEDLLSQSWLPKERLSESGAPDAFHPSGEIKLSFGRDGWGLNETQYGGSKGHLHYPGERELSNAQIESQANANQSITNLTYEYEIGLMEMTNKTFNHHSNLMQEVNHTNIEHLQRNEPNFPAGTNQNHEHKAPPTELTNQTDQLTSNTTQISNQNLGDVFLSSE